VIAGPKDVIEYLRIAARPFIFTASAVPAAIGATLAAVRICRSQEGRELFSRVLANAAYLRNGLTELGFQVRPTASMPDGTPIITAVVPVVVGDDWQAVFLWKALYEAGVFVNVAIHPAVPPGGALLRTSVMATHDAAILDRALAAFEQAKRGFEAEHGPLPTAA
jgi:8-amino-7-oxononanoate synthase